MFQAIVRVDKKNALAFYEFQQKKNLPLFVASSVLLLFAGAILIYIQSYTAGIIIMAVGISVVPIMLLFSLLMRRNFSSKEVLDEEITNIFDFNKDSMSVKTCRKEEVYVSKIGYDELFRAYETHTHLFLFVKKEQAFIVSLDGMTKGSSSDLIAHLRKKITSRNYKKM